VIAVVARLGNDAAIVNRFIRVGTAHDIAMPYSRARSTMERP
jgi:hypothetical protein